MKILMISNMDSGGGAALAAKRLCDSLTRSGHVVRLYVETQNCSEAYIRTIPQKKLYWIYLILIKIVNKVCLLLFNTTNKITHSCDIISKNDFSWINDSEYDVVHLHWINGVISIKEISKIQKPVVWTMHDSWACCGAEHHPNIIENDQRWIEGYYKFNKPNTTKGLDLCRYIWEVKRHYWNGNSIWFIAPSNWEQKVLISSALLRNNHCSVIPNILPFEIFYERDRAEQRRKRGIPKNKKVLGFGAAYGLDDPKSMKGTSYLIEALRNIIGKGDYYLIIFGPVTAEFTDMIPIPFYSDGYVKDPNILAELYSCCDCFINSSLIENFGYTIFESIACGTPVVAFNVGGTGDLIRHKENGYLAKAYESEDLAKGIQFCLTNAGIRKNCSTIRERFDNRRIVDEHIKTYEEVIKYSRRKR